MNYFLHDCHIRVVAIVGHGNHGSRGETPSEATRAHLCIVLVEEAGVDGRVLECVRVLRHYFCQLCPLLMKFLLVLGGVHDHVLVLGLDDHLLVPVAEKLSVRHQIEVWLPEGVIALLVLEDHIEHKCQLLPVALLLFRENLRVFFNDRT